MIQRIRYAKPKNYSDKVLVGAWVDDRYNAEPPTRENYKMTSTYSFDYISKPPSKVNPTVLWDQKLQSEDSSFISQIGRHDFPNYFENFSSTYDLSYHHYPKCLSSNVPRRLRFRLERYEPTDAYLPSFGNITHYGLLDSKRQDWKCSVQDPRQTYSTHYRDTFIPPNTKDYNLKRHAIPLANSSIMNATNQLLSRHPLRSRPIFNVTPHYNLVEVPRDPTIDPITWETKPK